MTTVQLPAAASRAHSVHDPHSTWSQRPLPVRERQEVQALLPPQGAGHRRGPAASPDGRGTRRRWGTGTGGRALGQRLPRRRLGRLLERRAPRRHRRHARVPQSSRAHAAAFHPIAVPVGDRGTPRRRGLWMSKRRLPDVTKCLVLHATGRERRRGLRARAQHASAKDESATVRIATGAASFTAGPLAASDARPVRQKDGPATVLDAGAWVSSKAVRAIEPAPPVVGSVTLRQICARPDLRSMRSSPRMK
jgi:hypothetical protein